MGGDNLDVLMPRAAVPVFVLDTGIREPDVPIVVRQFVLARPPRDLLGLAIRPAVAVLLPSIALVEEPLIVALEFVVEDDTADAAALVPQSLVGALVGAIDLGVVRQLARLPDAGVEGLAGLVAAVIALVAIGLEEVRPRSVRVTARSSELSGEVRISPSFSRCLRLRRELCESSRRSWRSLSATTRNAPTVASARLSSPSIS